MKSCKIVAEKQEADKTVIAVTIDSHQGPPPKPADQVIRYDFVSKAGGWKIDESMARRGRCAPYSPTSSNIRALRDGLPIMEDRQAMIVNYCG